MLDEIDSTESRLRQILWDVLKTYSEATLLELCTDDDAILRTAAAKQIHICGGAMAFEKALEFCRSEQPFIREIGCYLLGQLGTPTKPFAASSAPVLVERCTDADADVRAAAVAALGHLAVENSVVEHAAPAVIAASTDPDAGARMCAAFAISRFRHEAVEATLRTLATDADQDVREWAELGLEILEDRRARER